MYTLFFYKQLQFSEPSLRFGQKVKQLSHFVLKMAGGIQLL